MLIILEQLLCPALEKNLGLLRERGLYVFLPGGGQVAERCVSAARATTPGLSTTLAARRLDALVRRFVMAHGTGSSADWSRCRATRWDTMKQTFDTDVFVDARPMDALAGSDQTEIRALLWRGLR